MRRPKSRWDNNHIQFARLITELLAAGAPTRVQLQRLKEGMELSAIDIENIFDRAAVEWERAKALRPVRKHTPEREVYAWRQGLK